MEVRVDDQGNEWVLSRDGKTWQPAPEAEPVAPVGMGLLQTFGQGGTFGWGDELSAGLSAGLTAAFDPNNTRSFSENYADRLNNYRQDLFDYAADNPNAALGAEILGGVATGGAGLSRATANYGLKGMMAAGAAEGALYGAGAADTDYGEGRLEGGIKGGALGVPFGFAAHVGGKLINRVMDKADNMYKSRQAQKEITEQIDLPAQNVPKAPAGGADADNAPQVFADTMNAGGRNYQVMQEGAQGAIDEGYKLSPWQKYGTTELKRTEEALITRAGGSPWLDDMLEHNQRVFNRKVGQTIGLDDVDNLGAANMDKAMSNITSQMDQLTNGKTFPIDERYLNNLDEIQANYKQVWGVGSDISKTVDAALDTIAEGAMTGKQYQRLYASMGKRMTAAAKNGRLDEMEAYAGFRDMLDNIVSDSLSPEELAQWAPLRQKWHNIEMLMKSGVLDPGMSGNVSAASLSNRLKQDDPKAYMRGSNEGRNGQLNQITRTGRRAMAQSATSRTAERLMGAQDLTDPVGGLLRRTIGEAQEIPYRLMPDLYSRQSTGNQGLLGGMLGAEQGREDEL